MSRRAFEQEILSSTKEADQLKQYVKQIQIENNRLRTIVEKFERLISDYVHENDRLKEENQHLLFLSYSKEGNDPVEETDRSSDRDICYLTLKCLTYEVAQRLSTDQEIPSSTSLMLDQNDLQIKQRLNDTERQVKDQNNHSFNHSN